MIIYNVLLKSGVTSKHVHKMPQPELYTYPPQVSHVSESKIWL